jgi:hypothetical protein
MLSWNTIVVIVLSIFRGTVSVSECEWKRVCGNECAWVGEWVRVSERARVCVRKHECEGMCISVWVSERVWVCVSEWVWAHQCVYVSVSELESVSECVIVRVRVRESECVLLRDCEWEWVCEYENEWESIAGATRALCWRALQRTSVCPL